MNGQFADQKQQRLFDIRSVFDFCKKLERHYIHLVNKSFIGLQYLYYMVAKGKQAEERCKQYDTTLLLFFD